MNGMNGFDLFGGNNCCLWILIILLIICLCKSGCLNGIKSVANNAVNAEVIDETLKKVISAKRADMLEVNKKENDCGIIRFWGGFMVKLYFLGKDKRSEYLKKLYEKE